MNKNFLTVSRLRPSTTKDGRTSKQKFESDRGRILFSSPLRRLQSKAQVFSLESNASVRSRLTHSMEVAHIGRYISHQLKVVAKEKDDVEFCQWCDEIEPIVETACLLHDIGNPPFGHLGEKAIQNWFSENSESLYKNATGNEIDKESSWYKDFEGFDGNPQGARISLTLQGKPGKKGFNLTCAQLGAIIKYPRFSDDKEKKFKKFAVFTSERNDIESVWGELGYEWGVRHPLVYLMEASDDIAYSLSDIEDGIEKRIISEEQVLLYLKEKFSSLDNDGIKKSIPNSLRPSEDDIVSPFIAFRTSMINLLTRRAAEFFYENRSRFESESLGPIFDTKETVDDYSLALSAISDFCFKYLYSSREAVDIEIAGYNIVYGVLSKFSPILSLSADDFRKLVDEGEGDDLCRRMFSKLPDSLVKHYIFAAKESSNEWFLRVQLIVDYVSGMTDDFSLRLYRLLHGIEVEVI